MMNRKSAFKTLVAITLISAMVLTATFTVLAKSSINDNSNKPVVPNSGVWTPSGFEQDENWQGIVSVDVDPSKYEDKKVAKVVTEINNGASTKLVDLPGATEQTGAKANPETFPTTMDFDVDLRMYDRITDFYELKEFGKDIKPGEVSIRIPSIVGMKGSDLMIIIFDAKTGEMYLVPPTDFNSELGLITVDLPCTGPYCVAHKIPIVVRNVDPDKYPNAILAEQIRSLPDDKIIECRDFLEATGVKDLEKLEVAKDVFIDPDDYSAAIALSDVAVRVGRDDFDYNLSSRFKANLFRGNDKVDWERILDYGNAKYDKKAILADDKELIKQDPIKLNKCFIYHIDAATHEVSIIYEPTVLWDTYGHIIETKMEDVSRDALQYFDVDDIDPQNDKDTRLKVEKDADKDTSFLAQSVYAAGDEEYKESAMDEDDVCMIMQGDRYLGMGPFLLFMPKHSWSFPWWIL
ncbi:MAG: hypothetical protein MJ146_05555, partial [Clostridia bacterium]|nr:hypothetical protein [Clostridia bacterium]